MKLYGLAILPDLITMELLVDWRKEIDEYTSPPVLGHSKNLPHCSILQCPFYKNELTKQRLDSICNKIEIPINNVKFSKIYIQPPDWIFLGFEPDKTLYNIQKIALSIMSGSINTNEIQTNKSFIGYSIDEVNYYKAYGYRFINKSFRPHITVSKIVDNNFNLPEGIVNSFERKIRNVSFSFERIVFYEAGDGGALVKILHSNDIKKIK